MVLSGFYPGTAVSSTNKTEILLKVALNTINQTNQPRQIKFLLLSFRDGDGIQDASDNCPELSNGEQVDTDGDGTGM